VRLCAAADRFPSAYDPMFLVSLDSDSRHNMNHYWPAIDRQRRGLQPDWPAQMADRRLLEPGTPGYIDCSPLYNYLPNAPRMCDATQFPIESLFAAVKRRFWKILKGRVHASTQEMMCAIRQAFAEAADRESITRRFEHAERNMRVFSGLPGQTVELDGVQYYCTHGSWLPKELRG